MDLVYPKAHTCAKSATSRYLRIIAKTFLLTLFTLIIFSAISPQVQAGQAALTWGAAASTAVSGYRLSYGTTSGVYSQNVDVGFTTSYTLGNLTDGQKYYFVVSAYNAAGDQSAYSNEVSKTMPIVQETLTISKTGTGTGTVSGTGISCGATCTDAYNQGTVVTLTASADTGSAFAGWTGGGCSGTGQCTVTLNAATNVTAAFNSNIVSDTITATANGSGTITAINNNNVSQATSGSTTITTVQVTSGSSQAFSITPNAGNYIAGVTVDGAPVGAVTSYTFSNISANHTISATFAANSPTSNSITSSSVWQNQPIASQSGVFTAGFDTIPNANNSDALTVLSAVPAQAFADGATVVRFNSSGNIDVRNGSAYAADVVVPYTAGNIYHVRMSVNVPNHVYDVYVTPPGGTEIHLAAGYAFRTEQATVTVLNNLGVFADIGSHQVLNFAVAPQVSYSISASAGSGGVISPAGTATINSGGGQTYTIAPATGYKIAGVTVDGAPVGAVPSYTFGNVNANHTITASFTPTTSTATSYTIKATVATKGGTISSYGTSTVQSGASKTYAITANSGFAIKYVLVDGVSVGAVTSYTFSNVTANHTIKAYFK